MRYLVKAKLKQGKEHRLMQAIDREELGLDSVAGDEYLHDMAQARQLDDETVCWVETCFCPTPLEEERPYWEEYFELLQIKNTHDRRRCKDVTGAEPWSCCDCDCTKRLEARMAKWGKNFSLHCKRPQRKQNDQPRKLMRKIEKPQAGEYPPYAIMYIGLLPDDGLVLQYL